MLTLAPMRDKTQAEKIFKEKGFVFTEFSNCVTATCGEECLGLSLYELDNKKIIVHYIEPLSDIPLAEGILRSTLHVAAEKSIMNAFYDEGLPEEFLEKINFIKSKNDKSLNIDKLFESCCNCGK